MLGVTEALDFTTQARAGDDAALISMVARAAAPACDTGCAAGTPGPGPGEARWGAA